MNARELRDKRLEFYKSNLRMILKSPVTAARLAIASGLFNQIGSAFKSWDQIERRKVKARVPVLIAMAILCLPLLAATNEIPDLGVLTATNQIVVTDQKIESHLVIEFECLDVRTNVYILLAHKEPHITREHVPAFLVGKIKMSVSAPGTETNVSIFTILKPAPRVRLSRRYPRIEPPAMPLAYAPPPPLPGGTNMDYADWQKRLHMRGPTRQRRPE